jgi:hypothetical protein
VVRIPNQFSTFAVLNHPALFVHDKPFVHEKISTSTKHSLAGIVKLGCRHISVRLTDKKNDGNVTGAEVLFA